MSVSVSKNTDMRSRVIVGVPLFVIAALALLEPGVWLALMILVCFFVMHEIEKLPGGMGAKAGWSAEILMALVACGLIMGSGLLRMTHNGLFWVILIGIIVIANDVAALLIGRWIGEHPFFASISPNKTLEGALGGMAVGYLVGTAIIDFASVRDWHIAYWPAFTLCLVIPVAAVAGDLCESKVKRLYGVKDMGNLLPGHGGVTDRVDALSAAWLVGSLILACSGAL